MLLPEALAILQRAKCPYLTTEEEWWVEKMLYEKSPTRSGLLLWVISKLSTCEDAEIDDTLTTGGDVSRISGVSSAPSSKTGLSSTSDDGIHTFLRATGICHKNDTQFVSGDASRNEQEIIWTRLLNALKHIGVSPHIVRAVSAYLSETTSAENFLDIFKMKADLMPPDLDQEYRKRVSAGKLPMKPGDLKANLQRIEKAINTQLPTKSHPIVEADLNSMAQAVGKLQCYAEAFQETYRHELKQHTSMRPVIPQDPENVLAQKLGETVSLAQNDVLALEQGLKHRLKLQNLIGEIKSVTSDLLATEEQLRIYKKELELLDRIDEDRKQK